MEAHLKGGRFHKPFRMTIWRLDMTREIYKQQKRKYRYSIKLRNLVF